MTQFKIEHFCPRGPTLRLEPDKKCPLCGHVERLHEQPCDDLAQRLIELDRCDNVQVTTWEAEFISSLLCWSGSWTWAQIDKAKDILERYE
jgi:hypothetical protein